MNDTHDTNPMYAFAGPLSFMRRPYSRDASNADLAIVGVPFDLATTNRPGTRFGPRAIREGTTQDATYGNAVWPLATNPFETHRIVDYGDLNFRINERDSMLEQVEDGVGDILDAGCRVLSLGGDHYVSYPLLKAHAARHGPLSLIHFDAHSDTWAEDEHNHGTMFFHAMQEGLIDPARSIQVGMRTPNAETHGFTVIDADELMDAGWRDVAQRIRETVAHAPAYLTFDIDFLDPAYAPGTGTPVTGGPSTQIARRLVRECTGLNVVGGDLVEVAPAYDHGGITAVAAATLAIEIACVILSGTSPRGA